MKNGRFCHFLAMNVKSWVRRKFSTYIQWQRWSGNSFMKIGCSEVCQNQLTPPHFDQLSERSQSPWMNLMNETTPHFLWGRQEVKNNDNLAIDETLNVIKPAELWFPFLRQSGLQRKERKGRKFCHCYHFWITICYSGNKHRKKYSLILLMWLCIFRDFLQFVATICICPHPPLDMTLIPKPICRTASILPRTGLWDGTLLCLFFMLCIYVSLFRILTNPKIVCGKYFIMKCLFLLIRS